jgi:hypothetical protein
VGVAARGRYTGCWTEGVVLERARHASCSAGCECGGPGVDQRTAGCTRRCKVGERQGIHKRDMGVRNWKAVY